METKLFFSPSKISSILYQYCLTSLQCHWKYKLVDIIRDHFLFLTSSRHRVLLFYYTLLVLILFSMKAKIPVHAFIVSHLDAVSPSPSAFFPHYTSVPFLPFDTPTVLW